MPHEAANDVFCGFGLLFRQTGRYQPQCHSGAVHGLRAEQQKRKKRTDIFKAALGDFFQMVAPLGAVDTFLQFLFG